MGSVTRSYSIYMQTSLIARSALSWFVSSSRCSCLWRTTQYLRVRNIYALLIAFPSIKTPLIVCLHRSNYPNRKILTYSLLSHARVLLLSLWRYTQKRKNSELITRRNGPVVAAHLYCAFCPVIFASLGDGCSGDQTLDFLVRHGPYEWYDKGPISKTGLSNAIVVCRWTREDDYLRSLIE